MPKVEILAEEWYPVLECHLIKPDEEIDKYPGKKIHVCELNEKEIQLLNEAREKFNQIQKLLADKSNDKFPFRVRGLFEVEGWEDEDMDGEAKRKDDIER
jgi:hypothetical protein